MRLAIAICFLLCASSEAATYYVTTTGSDSADGSQGTPWLTLGKAETAMVAGDTVRIADGTYAARVTINQSGSSGNYINYIGNATGTGVVTRGFDIDGADYIRIIGIEITHTSTTWADGIQFTGNCTDNQIIDCYIHDVNERFIGAEPGSFMARTVIRGNQMFYSAHPGSTQVADVGIGAMYTPGNSLTWLVEYNNLQRSGDYMYLFGSNNICRNNVMWDTIDDIYWTPNGMHWDGFQPGSDGAADAGMRNQLYEANIIHDIRGEDGHYGIWQDTFGPTGAGDSNCIVRGGVGANIATGGIGMIGTDGMRTYNNTFSHTPCDEDTGTFTFYQRTFANALIANNIIAWHFNPSANDAIGFQVGTGVVANNLGYLSGSQASFVSTANPLFVNTNNFDFRLDTGSPAIGIGLAYCEVTSSTGSGTTFTVSDSSMFTDGYGICEGDIITVGSTTTRITAILADAITVASSISWVNGDDVFWGSDSTPDLGAIPYGTVRLTYATIAQNGTTYTVTPTGTTRGVWFYVNGIPTTWDYTSPYQATIASGTVTAKAYALYAQINPVVNATAADESVYTLGVSGTMSVGTLNIAQ